MRFDRKQRGWLRAMVIILAIATAIYIAYALASRPAGMPGAPVLIGSRGPRGGSLVGLAFGVVAAALVLFAGILGVRRKALLLRVGTMTWWTQAHVWLGALALPLVFFHSGFRLGGSVTAILAVLAILVVGSGVVGAALQHAIPSAMSRAGEATYEQLERWREHLALEAYREVAAACGHVEGPRAALMPLFATACARKAPPSDKPVAAQIEDELKMRRRERGLPDRPAEGAAVLGLASFYASVVAPYLDDPRQRASLLSSPSGAASVFDGMRPRVPQTLERTFGQLESIAASARAKAQQAALHGVLQGWLLVHVPLAMGLFVLLAAHVVSALYF